MKKKIESLKGSDALLTVIENDIQRLVNKGFISIKRGMYIGGMIYDLHDAIKRWKHYINKKIKDY